MSTERRSMVYRKVVYLSFMDRLMFRVGFLFRKISQRIMESVKRKYDPEHHYNHVRFTIGDQISLTFSNKAKGMES